MKQLTSVGMGQLIVTPSVVTVDTWLSPKANVVVDIVAGIDLQASYNENSV